MATVYAPGANTFRGVPPPVPTVATPNLRAATASPNAWMFPQTIIGGSVANSMGGGTAAYAVPMGNQGVAPGGNAVVGSGNVVGTSTGPSAVSGAPVIFGLSLGQVAALAIVGAGLVYVLTR